LKKLVSVPRFEGETAKTVARLELQIDEAMNAQITQKIIDYFKDKPVVKKVYIFGSYARGEETPESDVDILVDLDYMKEPLFSLFEFGGMLEDLKDLLKKDVDLLSTDGISKYIRPYIENDRILIYGE
jgi:uncharacterized protein